MVRSFVSLVSCSFLVAGSAALAIGCTAPAAEGDNAEVSESGLRALESSEIVGTIAYGQTLGPIHYTENPRYRALKFTATAGDKAKFTLKSQGISAAWILKDSFDTLAQARATGLGQALTIERELATGGTYYLAFREADQEDADFTVTLERTNTPPVTPPVTPPSDPGDVFDPASCDGPRMTIEQARARFAPAATSASLGRFGTYQRSRACNNVTGCAAWTSAPSKPQINWYHSWYNQHYGNQSESGFIDDATAGDVTLVTTGSSIVLNLVAKPPTPNDFLERRFTCPGPAGDGYCTAKTTKTRTGIDRYYYDQVFVNGVDAGTNFTQTLTNACFRTAVKVKTAASADGSFRETELVYLARF